MRTIRHLNRCTRLPEFLRHPSLLALLLAASTLPVQASHELPDRFNVPTGKVQGRFLIGSGYLPDTLLEGSCKVGRRFEEGSRKVQGTFLVGSGYLQGTYREGSRNLPDRFKVPTGKVQGTFLIGSGYLQGTYLEPSGYLQGRFPVPSRNLQGTFLEPSFPAFRASVALVPRARAHALGLFNTISTLYFSVLKQFAYFTSVILKRVCSKYLVLCAHVRTSARASANVGACMRTRGASTRIPFFVSPIGVTYASA